METSKRVRERKREREKERQRDRERLNFVAYGLVQDGRIEPFKGLC